MDEAAPHDARHAAHLLPCVFGDALARGCASCGASARIALAERESMTCTLPPARQNCATLAAMARERAAFALRLRVDAALPHAMQLRLQCGCLTGLRRCTTREETDVRGLVLAAQTTYGSLADLPWRDVVAAIKAWQGRRPHSPKAP